MLEKNGSVVLTEDDISKYNAGVVSERVRQTWGLSLDELRQVVENKQFGKVKDTE